MSENPIAQLADGGYASLSLLSRAFDVSCETVKKHLLAAGLKPCGDDPRSAVLSLLVKMLSAACETIPDDLERECRLVPAQVERIEDRLDALREDLHARLEAAGDAAESVDRVA